jgi:uncharacterized alkaline shock family protein YloU
MSETLTAVTIATEAVEGIAAIAPQIPTITADVQTIIDNHVSLAARLTAAEGLLTETVGFLTYLFPNHANLPSSK